MVPYRATTQPERAAHLRRFLTDVHDQVPGSFVMIAEQCDDHRKFNRGALFNAAVRELPRSFQGAGSITSSDVLCLHDVDMIPEKSLFDKYTTPLPPQTVRHIGVVDRYSTLGSAYLGGILMIRVADYIAVNGHSNGFWGWGGEDDEFYKRLKAKHFTIERVIGRVEDLEGFSDNSQKIAQNIRSKNTGRNKHRGRKRHECNPGLLELKYSLLHDYVDANTGVSATRTRARIVLLLE